LRKHSDFFERRNGDSLEGGNNGKWQMAKVDAKTIAACALLVGKKICVAAKSPV
jgi:hypothetical protein